MRALVLGGTRHLGAHVVSELRKQGHDVAVVDFGNPASRAMKSILSPAIPLQLISPETPEGALAATLEFEPIDFDVVFLCDSFIYSDFATRAVTAEMRAAHAAVARRLVEDARAIVLTSSAEVYDVVGKGVIDEGAPAMARTDGAHHSLELERMVEAAGDIGTPNMVMRCAIPCGSGKGVKAARRHSKSGYILPGARVTEARYPNVTVRLDDVPAGAAVSQLRDFAHVSDLAAAHVAAAEYLVERGGNHLFNVGSGASVGIGEALEIADAMRGMTVEPTVDAAGQAYPTPARLSIEAAKRVLGWVPLRMVGTVVGEEMRRLRSTALAPMEAGSTVRFQSEYGFSLMGRSGLSIFGLLLVRDKTGDFRNDDVVFEVRGTHYRPEILTDRGFRVPFRRVRLSPYRLRVPPDALREFLLDNPVRAVWVGPSGRWFRIPLTYSLVRNTTRRHRSRLLSPRSVDSVLYVRQSPENHLSISMRARNVTDAIGTRLKIRAAKVASMLPGRRGVFLYEKNGAHYEESAKVVFEELLERGRRDVFFLLAREMVPSVPAEYRGQILRRFSFRHFYHFFRARTFIGTESLTHAAELRTSNRLLLDRISRGGSGFVFLQHGVMYMVALDSRQRGFFRAGEGFPAGMKVVCSSTREGRHFIDQGGFSERDLYLTGLPKFDRARRREDADLILIMATWRPWEHNSIRTDPNGVASVRMLAELFDAVPERLKAQTYIVPHPLVRDALLRSELATRIWADASCDEALTRGALLITDYSSLAYDAFYRGTNVIFWWREKDECMRRYGGHLMIDEQTAPGPVARDSSTLRALVEKYYAAPQEQRYVARFRDIVDMHDGGNTARLLVALEKDGLI